MVWYDIGCEGAFSVLSRLWDRVPLAGRQSLTLPFMQLCLQALARTRAGDDSPEKELLKLCSG
jgi:hypothetical protein